MAEEGEITQRGRHRLNIWPPGFAVFAHRVDPYTIANPDLVGMADRPTGIRQNRGHLHFDLGLAPFIIRVQKRDPVTSSRLDAPVARPTDSKVWLRHQHRFRESLWNPL
ncbi:MAG: hypothetical protein Ct9H300mP16_10800 [Pseudomonadota bacterium]|nr:MAG: hypothetical protein Ct9H300mP16_10800 [Pseudomonadota bacterium]